MESFNRFYRSPGQPGTVRADLPKPFGELQLRADWLVAGVIRPTLEHLGKRGIASDKRAEILLTAIACQESLARERDQITNGPDFLGPALGLWQFERGGGIKGVLAHARTSRLMNSLCAEIGIINSAEAHKGEYAADRNAAWVETKYNDYLACVFARLFLWTDWKGLPHPDDSPGGWDAYVRVWRPGKPHPATWSRNWQVAQKAVFA